MKIKDIADIINTAEARFEVNKWMLDGIHIWPLVRIDNYFRLSQQALHATPGSTRSAQFALRILSAKLARYIAMIKDRRQNAPVRNTDVVFLSDGISFTKLNNKWYHKLCDPIAAEFSKNGYNSVRFDLFRYFLVPRFSPSRFIQPSLDNIIIRSLLSSRLATKPLAEESWGDFDDFVADQFVRSKFANIPSKKSIRARVAKLKNLRDYFIKQLHQFQPKIAFVVNYYSDDQLAFVLACKHFKIPVVDIQHGVQGNYHLSYGSWNAAPPGGYAQLPDYFWVWSAAEKTSIDSWSQRTGTHTALVGGNLFGELWRDETLPLVRELDIEFGNALPWKDKPVVLLTLSPNTEELMPATWEAVRLSQEQYNWCIRLHPAMQNNYKRIKRDIEKKQICHFELKVTSCLPLFSVLRNADAHVTCQSSSVIEAAEFNVTSVITSEYGKTLYENVIFKNQAHHCETVPDILSKLSEIVGQKSSRLADQPRLRQVPAAINELINLIR